MGYNIITEQEEGEHMAVRVMTKERALNNAIASTQMEGFVVSVEQRDLLEKVLNGELSLKRALEHINDKYVGEV